MFSAYRSLKHRLLNFDPGYSNLRSALRGTSAVVASFFCVSALAHALHTTPSLAFLGVLMTMMASIVVNDSKKSDQKLTTFIIPVPTILAAVGSVSLMPWPYARLVGFLLLTFVAVSVRRFGSRWVGIGVITFMAYFSTLFFPFHLEDRFAIALAIVIGIAIAYVARFWLLPDRPRHVLQLLLKTFDLRLNATLHQLAEALRPSSALPALARGAEPSKGWREVRQGFIRLNELCIAIDQFLDTNDSKSIRSKSDGFQLKLFEHEMALRRLWEYSFELLHLEQRSPALFQLAAGMIDSLRQGRGQIALKDDEFLRRLDEMKRLNPEPAVANFAVAFKTVRKTLATQDFTLGDIATVVDDLNDKSTRTMMEPLISSKRKSLHMSTRQAIQATTATALASLLGTTVSPLRWYWASVAAFMVFIGASRGETMMRAVLRIVGTVLGLVLGFSLAYFFSGRTPLEWTFIIACVFFGIYGSKLTFGFWTAGLFSSMFALLYDILGLLTKAILYLRLEETLIGAFIGVMVAAIVLPTSTHTLVRTSLATFLRTLGAIVRTLPSELPNPFARRALIRKLRAMDRELIDVRLAAAPILGRGSLMRHGELPGALHDATMLAHYVRHLGINVDPRSEMSKAEFDHACQDLATSLQKEADAIETKNQGVSEILPWSGTPSRNMSGPRHSLERIKVALASLASRKL